MAVIANVVDNLVYTSLRKFTYESVLYLHIINKKLNDFLIFTLMANCVYEELYTINRMKFAIEPTTAAVQNVIS